MKKIMIAILILGLLLCGCSRIDETVPGQPRVVTAISALYDSGAVQLRRQYTDAQKMQAVLTFLRCLDPYGTAAEDPESVGGNAAQITLVYSDESTKTYELRGDQYFRVNGGSWQNIRSEQAQELPLLLGLMESD